MKVVSNVVTVRPLDNVILLDVAVYKDTDKAQEHPIRIEVATDAELYVERARFIGPEYEKMDVGEVTDDQMQAYKTAKDHIERHLDAIKREAMQFKPGL